jgi:hypothetical protein
MENILKNLIQKSKAPIAIFDLDGTLFDVNYRHLAILNEFINQKEIQEKFPNECSKVQKIKITDFVYGIEATLNLLGIDRYSENSAHFIKLAEQYWFKKFFTDDYVLFDKPYEKAQNCVQWFHQQGVHIVYLTGRDIPNMSKGTSTALEKFGFPHTGHNVSMFLKPAYGLDDLLFKKNALELIQSKGEVIFSIDNEPANVQMFIDHFPEAVHVHFDSLYARKLELKGKNLFVIKSFTELDFLN